MTTCWKCNKGVDTGHPGRIIEAQRIWTDDKVLDRATGMYVNREDHEDSLAMVDFMRREAEDHKRKGLEVECDPERWAVSVPQWVPSYYEISIPDGGSAITRERRGRWTAFHDKCGPPSEISEAWTSDAWQGDKD